MDNQLLTLSKIFTERLFRIPDYQRGYAWTAKQLKDFWNDIQQLDSKTNHYTGVLTLEAVSSKQYSNWTEELWIIEHKGNAEVLDFSLDGSSVGRYLSGVPERVSE